MKTIIYDFIFIYVGIMVMLIVNCLLKYYKIKFRWNFDGKSFNLFFILLCVFNLLDSTYNLNLICF